MKRKQKLRRMYRAARWRQRWLSTPSLEVETKAGDSEPNKVIRVPPASECRASITEAADSAPLPVPKLF